VLFHPAVIADNSSQIKRITHRQLASTLPAPG